MRILLVEANEDLGDAVQSPDRFRPHGDSNRGGTVVREAVDAGPDQEVCPEIPSQTEEFMDVALAVVDMDAPPGIAEQWRDFSPRTAAVSGMAGSKLVADQRVTLAAVMRHLPLAPTTPVNVLSNRP